jgi:hypothetical protein
MEGLFKRFLLLKRQLQTVRTTALLPFLPQASVSEFFFFLKKKKKIIILFLGSAGCGCFAGQLFERLDCYVSILADLNQLSVMAQSKSAPTLSATPFMVWRGFEILSSRENDGKSQVS